MRPRFDAPTDVAHHDHEDMVNPPERANGLQRLAVGSTVATLGLISLGGAVRATDSGLACPTWPGCFHAGDFVPARDLHVWLEHSHRLFAGVVGLLIAAMTVWALARYRRRRDVLLPTLAAAVLVNVQALIGALVVWRLLQAELVTTHLGLAMIITACLITVAVNLRWPSVATRGPRDLRLATRTSVVAGLALVQILVGGHVTGIGAGFAYRLDGFPFMDGAVFPALATASERELFHASHRWLGLALLIAVVWLWRQAPRIVPDGVDGRQRAWLLRLPAIAAGLVALQAVIGVANLWSELSWVTVIPHLAVAAFIWAVLFLDALLAHRWATRARAAETESERELAAT